VMWCVGSRNADIDCVIMSLLHNLITRLLFDRGNYEYVECVLAGDRA